MTYFALTKQAPLFIFVFLFIGSATAQPGSGPIRPNDDRAAPRAPVRDKDVLWLRTVWQRIDLRQKPNHTIYLPLTPAQNRKSLFDYIVDGIMEDGVITPFYVGELGDDDMLTTPLNPSQTEDILVHTDSINTTSVFTGADTVVPVTQRVSSADIIAFDIKEHWYIDAERSVMDVRIVGIAPVFAVTDPETGEFRGTRRLFWLSFDEMRQVMASWPVYVNSNDVQYISYDDLFIQRRFAGTITKVSNVYDRSLAEYLPPMEALLQSLAERETIREMEMNMWNY